MSEQKKVEFHVITLTVNQRDCLHSMLVNAINQAEANSSIAKQKGDKVNKQIIDAAEKMFLELHDVVCGPEFSCHKSHDPNIN